MPAIAIKAIPKGPIAAVAVVPATPAAFPNKLIAEVAKGITTPKEVNTETIFCHPVASGSLKVSIVL